MSSGMGGTTRATGDDEAAMVALGWFYEADRLRFEIATLREFIADVRLGIRDLSEYEDVCGL